MIESDVKTKEGKEHITAYTVDEFEPHALLFKDLQRNHKFKKYATEFMTLASMKDEFKALNTELLG